MGFGMRRLSGAAVTVAVAWSAGAALAPGIARAEDLFEIQVYDGAINAPGDAGLELHANYAFRARTTAPGPREVPPDRVLRTTLEPSLGVLEWLELGAYLQGFLPPSGGAEWGGWKLRTKFILPASYGLPVRLGLNVEVGKVPSTVAPDPWGMEIRPILAWEPGRWLFAVNPNLDVPLSGPSGGTPELEPKLKVAWDTRLGFLVGAEWYAGLGPVNHLAAPRDQSHMVFGVVDLANRPGEPEGSWELQVALGGGVTDAASLGLAAKVIVGRGF